MTKTNGKFGLSLAAIAVIAFGFAALRQPQSVLLVVGFALLTECDEWLNRQALQALLLTIIYYLAELVTGWIFGGLASFFSWVGAYSVASGLGTAGAYVSGALYLALIVFAVLSVLRVLRGNDAGLPVLAGMAGGDFAAVLQKAPAVNPAPAAPQQPLTQAAAVQDAASGRHCISCGAALQEGFAFCTECGAKNE